MQSFVKIIPWRNDKTTLTFIDIGKTWPSPKFLTLQICHLTLFAKNKILVKISEFTVMRPTCFVPIACLQTLRPSKCQLYKFEGSTVFSV